MIKVDWWLPENGEGGCVSVCVWGGGCMLIHIQRNTPVLCPWDSPGKNTGMGCHFILQGKLPNPGMEPESLAPPALASKSFSTAPPGKPPCGYGKQEL